MSAAVMRLEGLSVAFQRGPRLVEVVKDVGFSVGPGEILAIVGESGSGKSVTLKAALHLLRGAPGVIGGQLSYQFSDGQRVEPYAGLSTSVACRREAGALSAARVPPGFSARVERRMRPIRGTKIGLALQDGRAALDPSWTIGRQLRRAISAGSPRLREAQAEAWLARLGFSDPRRAMAARPHQLSGGMAQRAMLAVVLAREPELLLLDEITTGLDVSLQAAVLELLSRLQAEVGFSAVLVTHDLGVARSVSERVLIMRHGEVMEEAGTTDLFTGRVRASSYTGRLLQLGHHEPLSRLSPVDSRLPGAHSVLPIPPPAEASEPPAPPTVRLQGVAKRFGSLAALSRLDLEIAPGSCLALVGESGSGKTTLSRIIAGLGRPSEGEVQVEGRALSSLSPAEVRAFQRRRAVLFQNPYTSLNPQASARALLVEGLRLHQGLTPPEAEGEAARLLARVQLSARADQPLYQLSGGERRRVGLLRTLYSDASLFLLDEPTSGLDAEHRSLVSELIQEARQRRPQCSLLVVSHDLGFVMGVADRVIVLYRGQLVEDLQAADFSDLAFAHHPYTQALWDASRFVAGVAPAPAPLPPLAEPVSPAACAYCARCPIYRARAETLARCREAAPALEAQSPRRRVACFGVQ